MLGIEALWAIDLLAYLLTRKKKQVVIAHEMGHDLLARKTNRIFYGPENPDAQVVKVEKSGGGLSTRLRCPRLLDRDRRVALLKNPALAASCSPFERQYVQEYLRARATVDVAGNMLEGYMVGRTIWGTDRADQKNLRDTLKTLVTLEENSNTWPPEKRKRFIADEKRRAYQEAESYLTGLDISKVREVHARMVEDIKNGKRCWTAGELDAYYQQLGLLEN